MVNSGSGADGGEGGAGEEGREIKVKMCTLPTRNWLAAWVDSVFSTPSNAFIPAAPWKQKCVARTCWLHSIQCLVH